MTIGDGFPDPTVARQRLRKAANELEQRLWGKGLGQGAPIILYFDESHDLHNSLLADTSMGSPNDSSLYDTLIWTLDGLSDTRMFAIFLSTTSNLHKFAPIQRKFPSLRILEDDTSQAPYTELPFDQHPDFPIKIGHYNLATSSKISFLSQFGRPL